MSEVKKEPPRGLAVAADAAKRMQELLRDQANPPTPEPSTQISNEISNEIRTDLLDEAITGVRTEESDDTRKEVPTEVLPRSRRGPRPKPHASSVPDPRSTLRERLTAQAAKEPMVRLSVDVSESLHARIRQYCADNRIPSSRFLIVTLVEDFLETEGY